jgi:uncharacterized membrane protein YjdF
MIARLKFGERIIAALSFLYILGFTLYYLSIRDYEFIWYILVLVGFFALIFATIRRSNFDYLVLSGLSLWGLLHLAGGGVEVGGEVLYRLHLLPIAGSGELFILKYDQAVHFFGFFVATLVVYHLLKPYLNERTNWKVVYPLIAAAGTGLGVLNEIVEFIAVLLVPNTGVGGYNNTALDLVFNTLGAIIALFVIHFYYRRKEGRAREVPLG